MSESINVSLGGKTFTVPQFTIGQQREVTRLFRSEQSEIAWDILGIALRHADPPVPDIDAVKSRIDEVGIAVSAILEHAGLKKDEGPSPPQPAAEAQPAADH